MLSAFKYKGLLIGIAAGLSLTLSNCSPDSKTVDLPSKPQTAFTAVPLAGNPNMIILTSTTVNAFMYQWDLGNGNFSSKMVDTVLYDQKGQYVIKLNAFNTGGFTTATQTVTIANDYPGVELIKGGDMAAGSQQYWTMLNTGGKQTTISFTGGVVNFSNSADANGAIYQAIPVKAGKTYTFSADVKGDAATNTWFEVYFGKTQPTQNADYSDNKFTSMNTWSGCGTSPFNGNLALIGCDGPGVGKAGKMTFATSGTIYLVIKAGSCCGGAMPVTGFSLDNVSVKEK